MTEQEEHRIKGVMFNSKSDFRRWRWKLIKINFKRLIFLILCWRREYVYALFLQEIQKSDSFESINERYQSKIFKG